MKAMRGNRNAESVRKFQPGVVATPGMELKVFASANDVIRELLQSSLSMKKPDPWG